jgi:hypothetical protein
LADAQPPVELHALDPIATIGLILGRGKDSSDGRALL